MAKHNSDEQDKLILRISECEQVVHELNETAAWKIVQRDMETEKQQIDDNWQNIWDEKKVLAMRVLKFACKHILDLKYKYEEELGALKKQLSVLENPSKVVQKDYDSQ